MSEYCLSNLAIDAKDVQEALEDVAYEEFDLICEDGSILGNRFLYSSFSILKNGFRYRNWYNIISLCNVYKRRG